MQPVEILAECLDGSPLTTACDYLFEHDNAWCKDFCRSRMFEPVATCWLRYAELKSEEENQ